MKKHLKKIKKFHIEAFGHAWDVKVSFPVFKFIFIGLAVFLLFAGIIYIANTVTTNTMTTGSRASTKQCITIRDANVWNGNCDIEELSLSSGTPVSVTNADDNFHCFDSTLDAYWILERIGDNRYVWEGSIDCSSTDTAAPAEDEQSTGSSEGFRQLDQYYRSGGVCISDNPHVLTQEERMNMERCDVGFFPCMTSNDDPACEAVCNIDRIGEAAACSKNNQDFFSLSECVENANCDNNWSLCHVNNQAACECDTFGSNGACLDDVEPDAESNTLDDPSGQAQASDYCTMDEVPVKFDKQRSLQEYDPLSRSRDECHKELNDNDNPVKEDGRPICTGSSTPAYIVENDVRIPVCEWGLSLEELSTRCPAPDSLPACGRNYKHMRYTDGCDEITDDLTEQTCRIDGEDGEYCNEKGVVSCGTDLITKIEINDIGYCHTGRYIPSDFKDTECTDGWVRDPLINGREVDGTNECGVLSDADSDTVFQCEDGWTACHAKPDGSNVSVAYCETDTEELEHCFDQYTDPEDIGMCINSIQLQDSQE